jgi:protein transport protein SEC13
MHVHFCRKVIIWKELGEWTKIYEHTGHDSSVNSVAWAPHEFGLILACGSSDGSISILTNTGDTWHAQKITNAHTIGCNAVSWCPAIDSGIDANTAQQRNGPVKRLATGGCDNLVKIWKEEGDRWIEENKLEAHSDWVLDGNLLMSRTFGHYEIYV